MTNKILWFITGAVIFVAGYLFSYYMADFTMSDAQARAYCHATVYYNEGVQEDDLYIQPSDIGKVDLKPMPLN